jgi:glycosyltransferase involved in cell wall biosynthesis
VSSDQFIILTPGFPRDEDDTTCIPWLQEFALSVKKLFPSLRLTIVAFQYPFEAKDYRWHGIRVIAIGGGNRAKLCRLLTWRKVWSRLNRLTREKKTAGVLSVWLNECALVGKYYCRARGPRHFMWLVGQDARESNRYINRIKPDGNQVIAFSDFLREELTRNFGITPFCVACNGINPAAFPELNADARPYDLVGVGSLIKLKNYSAFVDLAHRLKSRCPSLRAAIAGDGPERAALEAQIERLGLKQHVRLLGSIPHPQALQLMNNSKVFLHPSTYEGNSTVLAEALYAGCQAVSFQGLSRSPVENLRVCENEEQMLRALEELLTGPAWPVKRVLFNSMDDTARKIMSLYL